MVVEILSCVEMVLLILKECGVGDVIVLEEFLVWLFYCVYLLEYVFFFEWFWLLWMVVGWFFEVFFFVWLICSFCYDINVEYIDGLLGWYFMDVGMLVGEYIFWVVRVFVDMVLIVVKFVLEGE